MGLMLTLLVFFGFVMALIGRYLLGTYRLVTRLEAMYPNLWREELGAPRFVRHNRTRGLQFRFVWQLEPLWPYLRWLLKQSPSGLDTETSALHASTRRSFWAAMALFVAYILFFLFVARP